jgi:hypothetical protein
MVAKAKIKKMLIIFLSTKGLLPTSRLIALFLLSNNHHNIEANIYLILLNCQEVKLI